MTTKPRTPRVFVSSTVEDLEEYREAAKQALLDCDCHPVMHEYWEGADNPALIECLQRIDGCDLVIAIVAKRHGWTPPDQDGGARKSITRLECEHAERQGLKIVPFLLDGKAEWPEKHEESYRLKLAADQGDFEALATLGVEVKRNREALAGFLEWLCTERQRRLFATPERLHAEITKAVYRWIAEHPEFQQTRAASGFDRAQYREWMRRGCEAVELLGLDKDQAYNFRLQHVYVPAMVAWQDPPEAEIPEGVKERRDSERQEGPRQIELPLITRLGYESLYVPGAPGSGKSTFCRWLALVTASGKVPEHRIATPDDYVELLPESLRGRIPVLCYLRDFNDHKDLLHGSGRWKRNELESALSAWLDRTKPGELNAANWLELMANGECLMILDGVDELQTQLKENGSIHHPRSNFLAGLADALPNWHKQNNRVLLTSRPYGLVASDQRRLGLKATDLLSLSEPLQHTFIRRWFAVVDPPNADEKSDGIIRQLSQREDLNELRANPMLLTALCVKYDEGKRLPKDIHVLYHSIINQVLYGRYGETADHGSVRRRLAAVALGMHTGDAVRQARKVPEATVSYSELDEILAAYAGEECASEGGADNAARNREDLVSRSGLLLPRGEEQAAFYHLSFQEYLAAERISVVRTPFAKCLRERAHTPEWRRTLMFQFCREAENRPQVALDAIHEVLLPALDLKRLADNPTPALLLLDCLEIAHTRGWSIKELTDPLWQTCQKAHQSNLPAEIRNTLLLAAGKLGLDDRAGVGLDDTGLPDIAWCEVPAGRIVLEDDAGKFDVPTFSIARYPVTNGQFRAFVDANDGVRNAEWFEPEWIEAGWVTIDRPRSPSWTELNAPRETVSWHEAMAFCRWLDYRLRTAGRLTNAQQIRLPTEWEWQQAATGGDPNRTYPWPGEWDSNKLNSRYSEMERTSSVGLYQSGAAPCGAMDMAGNCWEWCCNKYDVAHDSSLSGPDLRVVRGGSWFGDRSGCRAAFRCGDAPNDRGRLGFRLCLSSPMEDY